MSAAATIPPVREVPASRSEPSSGAGLGAAVDEANRLYDARDWRGAEAAYQRAQEIVPDDPKVWARLCHVRIMQERFAAAVDTCQRAVQFDAKEPRTFQNLGYSLSRLGRHADALRAYATAIELAPDWMPPQEGTAAAYMAMANWAQAEASYRRMLAREPNNAAAWRALGDVAGEQDKSTEAIAAYQKALEQGRKNAETCRNLGWHLYRAGRYAEAEAALRDAQRLDPRDASALLSLGLALEKLGRRDEARSAWQRASDLEPAGTSGNAARQNLAAFAAPETRLPPAGPPATQAAAGAGILQRHLPPRNARSRARRRSWRPSRGPRSPNRRSRQRRRRAARLPHRPASGCWPGSRSATSRSRRSTPASTWATDCAKCC